MKSDWCLQINKYNNHLFCFFCPLEVKEEEKEEEKMDTSG